MKIGILRTGHSPDGMIEALGDYDEMFVRLLDGHGFTFQTFSVMDGEFPSGPQDADGWLITGSKHGAYEDHAWIPPLEELIRDINITGKPMIGVCFGHQIIAQALGGKVEKFAGGWSVGRTEYTMDGRTVALNAWHQDQVTRLPEFGPDFIDGLIRTRGKGVVPDDQLAAASAKLSEPLDSSDIATEMAQFFKSKARA